MKASFKILFIFLLFYTGFQNVFCQTREELEKRKKENIENLQFTRELLEKTKEQKSASINQLSILQRGINYREEIIDNLEKEIQFLQNEIALFLERIKNNTDEIELLKEEYARIIRKSYRNIEEEYALMYILGSKDINQSYQRIKYIRYLNDYRKQTIEKLKNLNDTILIQVQQRDSLIEVNQKRIDQLEKEQEELVKDRREKNRIVTELSREEKRLLAEIAERERAKSRIEDEIKNLLEEEARKAREENRIAALTPEQQLISDEFFTNQGRLPWPTEKGIITSFYGTHSHPVLRGVEVNNIGVDITTQTNTKVRSIFKGKVTKVIAILGSNFTVIIEHGKFRTVYQNLVDLQVKVGDTVETKQNIGSVARDENEVSKIHFMIWENMETVDPEEWLSK